MIHPEKCRRIFEAMLAGALLALASEAVLSARPQSVSPAGSGPALGADPQSSLPVLQIPDRIHITKKQQQAMLDSNYKKMKRQAAALATLAAALQKDIDRSNANVLSVSVIEKAKRIEKLARSIQSTARGY